MSVIVVVRKGSKAAIAADTLYIAGSTGMPASYGSKRSKIVAFGSDAWIGCIGSSAIPLILTSVQKKEGVRLDATSSSAIFESIRAMQDVLVDEYFVRTDEDDDTQEVDSNQIQGLICSPSGIFGLASYREVVEFDRFWAYGSGREFALGALYHGYESCDDPLVLAEAAVRAACEFNDSCQTPIHSKYLDLI